jgi:hypothetical protein
MEPWHNESRGGLPPVAGILAPGPVLAILVAVVRVCLEDPPVHHEERLRGRGECRRTAICLAPGTVDRLDDADVIAGKWWVDSDERAGVVAYLGDEARCEAVGLRLGAEDAEGGSCGGVVSFRTAGEPAAAAPLASRVEERSCARLFGQVRETRLERTAVCPSGTDSRARLQNSADFVGENQTFKFGQNHRN